MPPISELEQRVADLVARFLEPQIKNEADAAFIPDLDAIAAFRLLIHAEIEDWLEQCASAELTILTQQLVQKMSLRTVYRTVLLATLFSIPLSFELPLDNQKFRTQLDQVLSSAKAFIKDNNGIKAKSFCGIAMICGAVVDEIDTSLVAALDSYGKGRGQVAHKSAQRTKTLLAPSAEKAEVLGLIQLLKTFFATLRPV